MPVGTWRAIVDARRDRRRKQHLRTKPGQALVMSLPGIGSASATRHSGRAEGICKVLRLVHHIRVVELHHAHGVGRNPVVRDDALAYPQISTADDPEDGEVPTRRMPATLCRDHCAAPESFT